ncbi:MAG: DUF4065 domain-containing protein [Clostridia bacterium]|nr:DUF4065 domain-containing protein [Clostridia bacterium]
MTNTNGMQVLCPCCMKAHEQRTCTMQETNIINGVKVAYEATYEYCELADEYYATEQQIRNNDIAAKDAYRKQKGLLTSSEIAAILSQYRITQSDFSELLGWGEKNITRYLNYQIQSVAHDRILRKIKDDPRWFLELLENCNGNISIANAKRYRENAAALLAIYSDEYTEAAITSIQAKAGSGEILYGNARIDFKKIVDVINYIASHLRNRSVYTVKLMKMLWYSDFLSFKRRGKSITGLAYQHLPMGAVPYGYKYFSDLSGIEYEEVEFPEGTGCLFKGRPGFIPSSLSEEETSILDTVIKYLGDMQKDAIVNKMHSEAAFKQTLSYGVIPYSYASSLSIE